MLRHLASLGVNLQDKDNKRRTLLHHGARCGHLDSDMLTFMLEEVGLDLGSANADNKTPLDHAEEMFLRDHDLGQYASGLWDETKALLSRMS